MKFAMPSYGSPRALIPLFTRQKMTVSTEFHPARSPSQKTLRRRINNYSIYRTVRRAIRDCNVKGPVLLAPCGYGWFFERYQKDHIELVGIDIDTETVKHART